jgi:hypothetical protein
MSRPDPHAALLQLRLVEERGGVKIYQPTSRRQRGPLFETLGTTITRIAVDAVGHRVLIELPHPTYSTDFSGATALAERLDPHVTLIEVNAEPPYWYLKQRAGWVFAR